MSADEALIGESRWPPVIAVLVFMALNIALRLWLPSEPALHVGWLVPAVEAVFVLLLVLSNPTSRAERRRFRRTVLIVNWALVAAAMLATATLIADLIDGRGVANHADQLLADGTVVWLGNNLAFALLYWLFDSGGPAARFHGAGVEDFAFPQHLTPEVMPPGWRPVFLDYLHLGFTAATAFSPTDVMPLTHRAKYAMVVQSSVALALLALVVARAVGAFQ
jgi:hypothetical protein